MTVKTFQATLTGYSIKATVTVIGKDLLIALTGGDTPHIGTVTWLGTAGTSDSARFPSHHGRFHKDDVLSEALLKQIKPAIPGTCVITAGIHVNGIRNEQIQASFVMVEEIGKTILSWLQTYDFDTEDPIYLNYNKTEKETQTPKYS